ncbi:MAG: hypothetical protein AAF518_23895 [Spirochaetota bacterium]
MTANHPPPEPTLWEQIEEIALRIWKHARGTESEHLYAALSYIPIIGWLVSYFFRPKQKLCSFHALQAFQLNIIAGILFFVLWFITHFPPISWFLQLFYFQPIVTDFLHYTTSLAWLALSALGAAKAYQSEEYYLPYMEKLAQAIEKKLERGENA